MRAAIVGNAAYLHGKGLGPEIDCHDIVVRINENHTIMPLYPNDLGVKTSLFYVSSALFVSRANQSFPPGVPIIKKRHVNPEMTNEIGVYEANTGVLAILDFCSQGNDVVVYGMDFYSGAFGGIIPSECEIGTTPHEKQSVPRSDVYMNGYGGKTDGNEPFILSHIGGMRDFRVLLWAIETYGVKTDPYLQSIIEKNKERA